MSQFRQTVDFEFVLGKLSACKDARIWVGNKTFAEAWETCERSDWMLWFWRKVKGEKEISAKMAAKFVERVAHLKNNNNATYTDAAAAYAAAANDDADAVADAPAYAAATYAADAYAADAADAAAAYAADAAYAACAAATYAAYTAAADAADAAADAAYAAYDACAAAERKAQTDIIRSFISTEEMKKKVENALNLTIL